MIIDLMWVIGEVLSVAALLCGAYLALMETAPFRNWFGNKSAAAVPQCDQRPIDGSGEYERDVRGLSGNREVGPQS